MKRRVTGSRAIWSEAMKFSPMPRPITRGAGTGHHHAAVVTAVHHHGAVGAAQLLHRDLHGRQQAGGGFQLVVHQVGNHFGVGVGAEHIAQRLELFTQLFVVLDDTVVHYHDMLGDMG